MTPKERITAILNREPVDRIPVDLWHTPEIGEALQERLGPDSDMAVYRALDLDKIVWVFMGYREDESSEATGSQVGAQATGARTMWGVPLKDVQAGQALYQEFGEPPLAEYDTPASLSDYPYWPDPDRFDYAAAVDLAKTSSEEFATIGPWVSFFEIYCQLRGMEQAMIDLALDPTYVAAVLDEVEWRQTEMMERFFEQAAQFLDLTFISADVGSQHGLIMSPDMWERHFRDRMTRWCELIHAYGIKVFFHTDGASEPLIAPLIECGIDVLNPVPHAGPGRHLAELNRKSGEKVTFHGGVDNQFALPFGTPDDVRRETLDCLNSLGAGREGFICCSCHNVQAGTPVENILAMVETVREWGGSHE